MRATRRLFLLAPLCSLALAAQVALASGPLEGGSAQAASATPPGVVVEDGMTQPIYSHDDAIVERVWIETPVDTDADGEVDWVMADLARPLETETEGLRVPVIYEASPYRGDTWSSPPWHEDVDEDVLPSSIFQHPSETAPGGPGPNIAGRYDDYYVPRGYGVVAGHMVGTSGSDGCPTTGDESETLATKAVVDWLNGRAQAVDEDGQEVVADWSTGNVGMIGSSYGGTLATQVATTGVEGLKTIVPVAAISDWYNYYRQNGTPVPAGGWQGDDADLLAMWTAGEERSLGHCADAIAKLTGAQDRLSGNYNDFWDDRNYVDDVKDIEASVFVVHGRSDWNVKPQHFGLLWERLAHFDVERKIWLHDGGHGSPGNSASYTLADGTSWTYEETLNRWFDRWLWDIDNGITDEPQAIVEREGTGENETHSAWPDEDMHRTRVRLSADSADDVGGLTTGHVIPPQQAPQTFIDEGRDITSTLSAPRRATRDTALIVGPDTATDNRLAYVSDELSEPLRLSGTPRIRLRASIDNASAANLSVYLVDYGPEGEAEDDEVMVTRGWMSAQNRVSRDKTSPIMQGQAYDFEWDLHPDDYVFEAGRRIGLVVLSTDYDYTFRPAPGTQLTVQPGFSELTLPLVGDAGF